MKGFARRAFTPLVKAVQQQMGSRRAYAHAEEGGDAPDVLGPEEIAFLAERDSFYLASVGETGWPYVQHRGGPKGFVRVLDEHTLGLADLRGNRQYVSVGNLGHDDRVAAIFMDYPNRARLKLLARASIVSGDDHPDLLARLTGPGIEGRVERGLILKVEGLDWNCPQHITPRFTEEEALERMATLFERLEELEAENRTLRALVEGRGRPG